MEEYYRVTNEDSFYFGEIGVGKSVSEDRGVVLDFTSLSSKETGLWFALSELEKVEEE